MTSRRIDIFPSPPAVVASSLQDLPSHELTKPWQITQLTSSTSSVSAPFRTKLRLRESLANTLQLLELQAYPKSFNFAPPKSQLHSHHQPEICPPVYLNHHQPRMYVILRKGQFKKTSEHNAADQRLPKIFAPINNYHPIPQHLGPTTPPLRSSRDDQYREQRPTIVYPAEQLRPGVSIGTNSGEAKSSRNTNCCCIVFDFNPMNAFLHFFRGSSYERQGLDSVLPRRIKS